MGRRRVAIYGGTFDPVHKGHLEVARRVRELFDFDEVLFVPACVPPHKRDAGILSPFHRVAMLALATQDDDQFRISTIELDEPERPYAIDTVSRLQSQLGAGHRVFFLVGADSWAELQTWHQWQQLLKMCDLIVVTRPGYELRPNTQSEFARIVDMRGQGTKEILAEVANDVEPRVYFSDAVSVDVSATAIRAAARVNAESALQKVLPPAVANYITKHRLYRN